MNRVVLLGALADPIRLRTVALLRHGELAVGELAQILAQTQPGISRHAKVLIDAGVCQRRKEGSWSFLQLDGSPELAALLTALDRLDDPAFARWRTADDARLQAVQADRTDAAKAFFDAHAERWDAIRAMHVPDAEVADAIDRALGQRPLGRLVDVGTGQGRMLHLLGSRADHVIGIDRSPEMLRFARSRIVAAGIAHAELRQGDMYALPLGGGCADTVVLHQVLHYAQAPGLAIGEAARLLAADGRMLIVDVAPHHHDDLRQRYGHVRLGFGDDQIRSWLQAAGLDLVQGEALPGGELTVMVWLARRAAGTGRLRAVA